MAPADARRPLAAAAVRLRRPPGRPRRAARPPEPPVGPTLVPESARTIPPHGLASRLLDLAGTAAYLGVSPWTVRDLEAAGTLRRVRVPRLHQGELRKLLFDRRDLDQLIEGWKDTAPP